MEEAEIEQEAILGELMIPEMIEIAKPGSSKKVEDLIEIVIETIDLNGLIEEVETNHSETEDIEIEMTEEVQFTITDLKEQKIQILLNHFMKKAEL